MVFFKLYKIFHSQLFEKGNKHGLYVIVIKDLFIKDIFKEYFVEIKKLKRRDNVLKKKIKKLRGDILYLLSLKILESFLKLYYS